MPICTLPTVTIYEDFDKLSAKEVYFTESGDKVTVKLLHFPNLSPEEQEHLKNMSDSGDEHGSEDFGASGADALPRTRKKSFTRKLSNDARKFSAFGSRKNSKDSEMTAGTQPTNQSSQQQGQGVPAHHHHHHHFHHHHHHLYQPSTQHPAAASASLHHHSYTQSQQMRVRSQSTQPQSQPYYHNQLPIVQHPAGVVEPGTDGDGRATSRGSFGGGVSLRHRMNSNRSPSPRQAAGSLCPGYEQYQMSLLEVPMPRDYGDASSDDLSSEWDSDVPDVRPESGAKVR